MSAALTSIQTAIDFTTVLPVIGAVGVAMAGVYIMIKGIKIVLTMLRGA